MSDETTSDARADEGSTTGRRAFMAGAAGLAAGATLLGTGGPAGATPPATGEHDLALKWVDMSTGTMTAVGLGTGGIAKGIFSAFGDMAAVSIRIKLGSGPSTGSGPWCLLGSDMPTGYEPALPPSDITETGTSAWMGTGQVIDFSNLYQNAYQLGCAWSNFGGQAVHVWSLPDLHNTGSGNVMFNFGGTVPFGAPLAEGAFLYSSVVYLRDTTPPEE